MITYFWADVNARTGLREWQTVRELGPAAASGRRKIPLVRILSLRNSAKCESNGPGRFSVSASQVWLDFFLGGGEAEPGAALPKWNIASPLTLLNHEKETKHRRTC